MGVAQMVRVPGCGPGGRGFKSLHSPQILRPTATGNGIGARSSARIESQTSNLLVVGSNPTGRARFCNGYNDQCGPLAQLVEQLTLNQ